MTDFTLNTKNLALCALNGQTAKLEIPDSNNLTPAINNYRKEIIKALEKRNFNIPGIDVVFYHIYENGKHSINIASIICKEIDVYIGYSSEIRVGGFHMSLYSDNSGSLDVYCGTDWNKDREEFIYGKRFHRKMDGKSRIVLQYDYNGSVFRATDDCNRGYLPVSEPDNYILSRVEYIILTELNKLLNYINTFPEQTIDPNLFAEPMPTQLKNESVLKKMKLFTYVDRYKFQDLEHGDNTGINGGYRLLPLSIPLPEHPLASLMHEGFTYCDIQMSNEQPNNNIWHYDSDATKVMIKLSNMNNVFIVDAYAAEKFREDWFNSNPGIQRMTDDAYNEMQVARAVTMVRINDYDGSYKKPVVIVGRLINRKEIKLIGSQAVIK